VSWNEIATLHLPPKSIVSLAGCETLRRPNLPQTRTLSLGGGFLAAGAGDVIGTLAPIEDVDARELFREVHRHLAAGEIPAEAVRSAQLTALQVESAGRRRPLWRALALLTHRIPTQ
jgi:CHAT domain-containing protein